MGCVLLAVAGVVSQTIDQLGTEMPRHYDAFKLEGLAFFFGVSCYSYEGTGFTLEIYD